VIYHPKSGLYHSPFTEDEPFFDFERYTNETRVSVPLDDMSHKAQWPLACGVTHAFLESELGSQPASCKAIKLDVVVVPLFDLLISSDTKRFIITTLPMSYECNSVRSFAGAGKNRVKEHTQKTHKSPTERQMWPMWFQHLDGAQIR
jgi:hypothetical protein